jgi:hypothetical protein
MIAYHEVLTAAQFVEEDMQVFLLLTRPLKSEVSEKPNDI